MSVTYSLRRRSYLPAMMAISLIPFADSVHAQRCEIARDQKAVKALEDRAAAGDADAQCGLGKQYELGLGVPLDNKQAAIWLRKSAEQGNISAQVELGVVLGKTGDSAEALIWYRKAAEQGNARAEYNIGVSYQYGEAGAKDMAQAAAWYRRAADHGDAPAQNNIGVMYEHGIGVPRDYSLAADWYRKAAEQGWAESQYGLAMLYLEGKGLPKDESQATAWMLKAAEQGESKAQFNLGAAYVNGTGVKRDLTEAYFWVFLAGSSTTNSGLKQYAENTLQSLAKVLKKNDVKIAQRRAQAWLNEHPVKPDGALQ